MTTPEPTTRSDFIIGALGIIAFILFIAIGLSLWVNKNERVGAELRAHDEKRIEIIEDRYDITVDDRGTWSLSEWIIDGKEYLCEVTDLDEPTMGLSCMDRDSLTDFADMVETSR